MKAYHLLLLVLLLMVNVVAGWIITVYTWWNVAFSSIVLAMNFLFMLVVCDMRIKDAFKVSLTLLFPLVGLIEIVLSIVSPSDFHDNIYVVIVLLLFVLQIMTLAAVHLTSIRLDR